jgi:hypothetical protein
MLSDIHIHLTVGVTWVCREWCYSSVFKLHFPVMWDTKINTHSAGNTYICILTCIVFVLLEVGNTNSEINGSKYS